MLTEANYLEFLLAKVPEFKATYEEHLEDNEEVLDHPLFGELFHFTLDAYEQGKTDLASRIIAFINAAAQSNDESMLELVQLSFLEYLIYSPAYETVKAQLNEAAHHLLALQLGEVIESK